MTAQCVLDRLDRQCRVKVTKEYVCTIRRRLNWSSKTMKYGQLIYQRNVKHRHDCCIQQRVLKDSYKDVIYVDESCVEMCSSGRLYFHQLWQNLDRLPASESSKTETFVQSQYLGRDILQRENWHLHIHWDNGLRDLPTNPRRQLVFICSCKIPGWFSVSSA